MRYPPGVPGSLGARHPFIVGAAHNPRLRIPAGALCGVGRRPAPPATTGRSQRSGLGKDQGQEKGLAKKTNPLRPNYWITGFAYTRNTVPCSSICTALHGVLYSWCRVLHDYYSWTRSRQSNRTCKSKTLFFSLYINDVLFNFCLIFCVYVVPYLIFIKNLTIIKSYDPYDWVSMNSIPVCFICYKTMDLFIRIFVTMFCDPQTTCTQNKRNNKNKTWWC